MRAKPVMGILLRQFYLLRGSPVRSLPMFTWVAIDIVVWGFITRYLNSMAAGRFNYVPSLLGAVLMWDFFIRIMHGVSTAFLEDVWSRNFLNLFATPLTIAEYIFGLVLTSVATSAVGLVVMLVLATAVFGLSFLSLGGLLVPFLLILFAFGIALGILAKRARAASRGAASRRCGASSSEGVGEIRNSTALAPDYFVRQTGVGSCCRTRPGDWPASKS